MDEHELSAGGTRARIRAQGAELVSFADAAGLEHIWGAGPAWPRHAPALFPIVGRLKDDALLHEGERFPMTQHGFARDSLFEWVERAPNACRLALSDSATTRAQYPFAFRLEISYRLSARTLIQRFDVRNVGEVVLPASIGAHPAFNWPLRPELAKEDYALFFAKEETAPVRRLEGGLLLRETFPTPVEGRVLRLRDELFADDALILDHVASRSVKYVAPDGSGLDIAWDGLPELGLWSKPGANFLCVEPWGGYASPVDFDGPFEEKPGLSLIPPGATRSAVIRMQMI